MTVNGLQLYRGKKLAGLTDENSLQSAFLTEPDVVNNALSFIFGVNYGNPLALLTGGLGRVKTVKNRQYDWRLMGDVERPVAIVRNLGDGSTTPGLGKTSFRVVLADKDFVSGEILIPDNRDYPVRVDGDPYQDGDGFVYTLRLISPDSTKFMPPALLAPGKFFSKDYSAYEEGGSQSGITTYATPFQMRNHLTLQRKTYEITGSAATDVLAIQMKDPKSGKTSTMWTDVQEWYAYEQWYREQERSQIYSIFNANANGTTDLKGQNGRPVYIGAGLREQIAPANKRAYSVLTENIIRDFLMDLSYNVIDKGQRKFVALCGEGFMDLFDRAMKDSVRGWTLVDSKFITGSGQELTLGGQFTTYKGLNGTEVTLMHMPLYDDPTHNRQLHPLTNRPLESYRATFIDFGMYDGVSNIQKVAKQDRENVVWTTAGSVDPSGHSKSKTNVRSNTTDGYAVHMLAETGIMIQNPMSCGELYCDLAA
jgi:hypothetical protein